MTLFVSRLRAQGLSGSESGLKQNCGLACPEHSALYFSPIHETDLEIIEKRRASFLCGWLTKWRGGAVAERVAGWLILYKELQAQISRFRDDFMRTRF